MIIICYKKKFIQLDFGVVSQFFYKFHWKKEENFNRMMCEQHQQHDVFGRTDERPDGKFIQALRRHTKTSNNFLAKKSGDDDVRVVNE